MGPVDLAGPRQRSRDGRTGGPARRPCHAGDHAIWTEAVGAAPQVVILGAGLEARAWRMPELAEVDVVEVARGEMTGSDMYHANHPDGDDRGGQQGRGARPAARHWLADGV